MISRRAKFAGLALSCALSFGATRVLQAQDQSTTTKDQRTTTTTETHSTYDSPDWQAPRGYDAAYPESGKPNMVARQGYAAGFNQGEADASRGKKFKPTESDAYEHAKIPEGMNKGSFKQEFRAAFVKGYSNGYKKNQ